jgi:hypothetical protein
MSNAVIGLGTTLSRNGSAIAELTNIGGIEISMDTIDVTNHQSSGGFKEFIAGLMETSDLPIEFNFIPSDTNGQIGLQTDMLNRTLQSFVITFPSSTGTTWSFTALVTKFSTGNVTPEGKLSGSATLKISGQPTLGITLSNAVTAMTLSGSGTFYPTAWAGTTYEYVYSVLTAVSTITLTPTFVAGTCTITCGTSSQTVATGVASSAITLGAAGSVTTITVAIKETGKSPRTYTIKVARA